MLVVYTWASQMASCKRIYLPSRRYAFSPWVSKIPWRRKWQHTPVFLPDKSHGQRRLMGYGAWGHKESDNYLATKQWTTYTSVQFSSVTQSCLTLCNPMDCSTPGLPVYHRVYSNSCPLSWWCHLTISFSGVPFFSCLQSFTASGSFQMNQLRISWPKYWSFSFNISPSNEYSGLISFRMNWLDLFAVQGTLKSLLQHHSSKASILWCSAFFMAQVSHPYMTTGKTIALTRWTFVGKVICLLFNMLSGVQSMGSQMSWIWLSD